MPALVQNAPGPAGLVLRAPRPRGRRGHGADGLRPVDRFLRRSDREEAAQPLPARLVGPLVRHGRLQPRLFVLPELGHLEEPRNSALERARHAGHDCARSRAAQVRERRLHLQRPGHLHGIRARHSRRLPRGRREERRGHRWLYLRRAAQAPVRGHGRGERGPQGVHRALLCQALRGFARAGAGNARLSRSRDECLDGNHDAC